MFALPAAPIIRRRGWVIVAWAALALLFGPRACHVQQVLALRGGGSESTESSRATALLKEVFPTPFADYVAIVVHGRVRWTNARFEAVLDTLKAAVEGVRTSADNVRTAASSYQDSDHSNGQPFVRHMGPGPVVAGPSPVLALPRQSITNVGGGAA